MKKPFFLVITGPTGVGKTEIVLQLAERIPCEIINADSGQCYEPLTIGTAKPDWRHEKVPHHLFDIIDKPANISVAEFRKLLLDTIAAVISRGKLPIVVGGSVFYVNTLFFPLHETVGPVTEEEGDPEVLWERLHEIDPERAKKIHKNDRYRIQRALAIWQKTGKAPSLFAPEYQPPASFLCVVLTRDRDELYERIDERVLTMIDQGWLEEVEKLKSTPWEAFLKKKKIIGYDDILNYLDTAQSANEKAHLIATIQKKTRNYAKRQLIFLKKFEKKIIEEISKENDVFADLEQHVEVVNLTLVDVNLYIKQLFKKVVTLNTH